MDDVELDPTARHRALAHPLRHRLLIALGGEPATISQLARALDVRKGNVAHHMGVLVAAGLAAPGETRRVRGGTEQYYARVGQRITTTARDPESDAALLSAVAAEIAGAEDDPLLHLRYVRLTVGQANELRSVLDQLVSGLEPANADEARYGVLVSVFRR